MNRSWDAGASPGDGANYQTPEHSLGSVSRTLLERTVLGRMDGCTLRGKPNTRAGFDTVMSCPAQELVYPHIAATVELLEEPRQPAGIR